MSRSTGARSYLGGVFLVALAASSPAAERLTYPRCELLEWLATGAVATGERQVIAPVKRCETTLVFGGRVRPTPEAHAAFLRDVAVADGVDARAFTGYADEAALVADSATFWLLVLRRQRAALEAAGPRDVFRVRLSWRGSVGGEPILLVEELAPVRWWSGFLPD
jgi:hypothetical protein